MAEAMTDRTGAGPPPEGLVIGIVGAGTPVHSSGLAAATAVAPPVRLIPAPASLPTAEIVRRLNAAQPPALLAYAAKLAELAREQRAGRLRLNLRSVTSNSEMLSPAERTAIGEAFGVPVIDLFVSTEGLVGRSEPGSSVFTFASDTCLAECVDDDGRPVPDGVASAKVLVTNLHNLTQPLIRYELTDRFTPAANPAGGFLRASVDGRADDLFRYPAASVHPFVIGTPLLRAPAVREFQVRQTERGADLAVVADGDLDAAALTAAVGTACARRPARPAGHPAPGRGPRPRPPDRQGQAVHPPRAAHTMRDAVGDHVARARTRPLLPEPLRAAGAALLAACVARSSSRSSPAGGTQDGSIRRSTPDFSLGWAGSRRCSTSCLAWAD